MPILKWKNKLSFGATRNLSKEQKVTHIKTKLALLNLKCVLPLLVSRVVSQGIIHPSFLGCFAKEKLMAVLE